MAVELTVQQRVIEWIRTNRDGALASEDAPPQEVMERMRAVREDFQRLQLHYQFGIQEVATKVDILRQEFERTQDYCPIEHVRTRLKSIDSLMEKALKRGIDLDMPTIRAHIRDIAGIRITCSFVSDVYWIAEMLSQQPDLEILQTKDYIAEPKPNGYRSLHLIVQVPVFLARHTEYIPVELQIRTIAMDFWASMEHKLHYKYQAEMPARLRDEIDDAARVAAELDRRMGNLRDEIRPAER